jgi:hypothetical protein
LTRKVRETAAITKIRTARITLDAIAAVTEIPAWTV